jgi:hypothetical protein
LFLEILSAMSHTQRFSRSEEEEEDSTVTVQQFE